MCRTQTHKLVKRFYEKDELYDLIKDPNEVENIIDDPAYFPVIQQLETLFSTGISRHAIWYPTNPIGGIFVDPFPIGSQIFFMENSVFRV